MAKGQAQQIKCSYNKLVKVSELLKLTHPKNVNKHPFKQIERLAKILAYQGVRYPIKVSTLSGRITSGHGRLEAAKLLKWDSMPVDYQDYDDEGQEYADLVADNAIASWAELDFAMINNDVIDFGPELDLEMMGLENFAVEVADKEKPPDYDEVQFRIEVKFPNDMEMNDIKDDLMSRGYMVKVL